MQNLYTQTRINNKYEKYENKYQNKHDNNIRVVNNVTFLNDKLVMTITFNHDSNSVYVIISDFLVEDNYVKAKMIKQYGKTLVALEIFIYKSNSLYTIMYKDKDNDTIYCSVFGIDDDGFLSEIAYTKVNKFQYPIDVVVDRFIAERKNYNKVAVILDTFHICAVNINNEKANTFNAIRNYFLHKL